MIYGVQDASRCGTNKACIEKSRNFLEPPGISVNCKADAGILEEAVPYALAVFLEVPEEIGIDIYDEVTVRIEAARVTVTAE